MIQKIIKLLWPEICPFCGKIFRDGICPACKKKLDKLTIRHPRCMKCGKPIRKMEQEYCSDCSNLQHNFNEGRSLWIHSIPVSTSIYQFKYHNQRAFAAYYAQEMAVKFETIIWRWKPDIIIPIPLHIRRKRKRGYNQTEILARELGKRLNIPVNSKILKRIKYTHPQKKLDHQARKRNMRNAFRVIGNVKNMKAVLLLDDIYTTGNTIDEAAARLKEAGIENVYFLTVSIGQGY